MESERETEGNVSLNICIIEQKQKTFVALIGYKSNKKGRVIHKQTSIDK